MRRRMTKPLKPVTGSPPRLSAEELTVMETRADIALVMADAARGWPDEIEQLRHLLKTTIADVRGAVLEAQRAKIDVTLAFSPGEMLEVINQRNKAASERDALQVQIKTLEKTHGKK